MRVHHEESGFLVVVRTERAMAGWRAQTVVSGWRAQTPVSGWRAQTAMAVHPDLKTKVHRVKDAFMP